eukprot:3238281-Alexandrium_andersonii.AAC.1
MLGTFCHWLEVVTFANDSRQPPTAARYLLKITVSRSPVSAESHAVQKSPHIKRCSIGPPS